MKNFVSRLLVAFSLVFLTPTAIFAQVVISSKIDTEGAVLGQIILQTLEKNGIQTIDKISLGNTAILRKAIIAGEVDIYVEYSGNAAFFFNKSENPIWKNAEKGFAEAKKLDYDANKLIWLSPASANNTWAIALRKDLATPNNLSSLSDLAKYVNNSGKITLAASAEFVNSPAALPAFQSTYGFKLSAEQVITLAGGDTAATIKAAAEKISGANAAMVYGTDGTISASELVVLTDDKNVQPVYLPSPIIREAILKANPKIEMLLTPVFAKLDLVTMQNLNGRAQVNGESAKSIAADFLKSNGFTK